MAAPTHSAKDVTPDSLITLKISLNDNVKKFKLPLKDLSAEALPAKLRQLLEVRPEQPVIFERFSDSSGGFITLDPKNPQVFKSLVRAAKAKLKLRLKATVVPLPELAQEKTPAVPVTEDKPTQKTMEPVIVHSPVYPIPTSRDSTAFDRRSVGSGIFQFREARASQTSLNEAPVPAPFVDNKGTITDLAKAKNAYLQRQLAFRSREAVAPTAGISHAWSVYCNECDASMDNAHFHCSICDGGDYDLCERCVAGGKLCPGEGHWLIKRFIKDGQVITSTTERISPRKKQPVPVEEKEVAKEIPGAFTDDTKTLAEEPRFPTRTCNSCVIVLPEMEFVTCKVCDDFDLCVKCHISNKHGHHPAHGFKPATEDTVLPLAAETTLAPGRNVRHNAICDGCDKKIHGVRHKCLNCPDWDYCSDCVKDARRTHPQHRFAALFEPIADAHASFVRHVGTYCDGPLCTGQINQGYITGVRYKCAVCHDTDFCASCEAVPSNTHNRTHPLIKFKTPVKNVSITTENEDARGTVRMMGDRRPQSASSTKSASTETTPVQQANAATQVQTVAEIKPTMENKVNKGLPAVTHEQPKASSPITIPGALSAIPPVVLDANFVKDTIADGTVVAPGARFTQVWTMRNPGPHAWPAGCSIRFVGGDNMLNVDNNHPAAVSDIANATESNVTSRPVQIGEEVAFKILLKAPTTERKFISYWRIKAADGTPFGHRLWCDIEVKKPVETPASESTERQNALKSIVDAGNPQHERMQLAYSQRQLARQQLMLAQHKQALANTQNAMPPPYDAATSANTISARIAAMREAQSKRREQMMTQLNAQRDAILAQGIKREDMPSWGQHINPTIGSTAEQAEDDKARKEAARQRVEHIKAKILRAREEKAKAVEQAKENAAKAAASAAENEKKTEKVKKIIEEVNKEAEERKEEDVEGSQMVFPKLDKESPASSTYQSVTSASSSSKGKAAYVENEQGEIERSATPGPAPSAEAETAPAVSSPMTEEPFEELIDDDIEVLSAHGEDSDDDGFFTDEEYDILDASDSETVASK